MKLPIIIILSVVIAVSIGLTLRSYSNPTETKIEKIREEAELAGEYCYLSELHYCIENVRRIDSLYNIIDKMLSNHNLDKEYQIELINIRRDLEIPRSISDLQIAIDELDTIIEKTE